MTYERVANRLWDPKDDIYSRDNVILDHDDILDRNEMCNELDYNCSINVVSTSILLLIYNL